MPHDALEALVRIGQSPFVSSPLLRFIRDSATFAEQVELDEESKLVCSALFDPSRTCFLASDSCSSASLGVDRKKYKRLAMRVATAAMLLQRETLVKLEKGLASSARKIRLLHYCEHMSYDETPMPIRLDDKESQGIAAPSVSMEMPCDTLRANEASHTSLRMCLATTRSSLKSSAGTAKLFQIQSGVGMLVEIEDPVARKPMLACITADLVNWLQVVDRTTAEVIAQCIRNVAAPSLGSCALEQRTRLAMSDRYSANLKAEKMIQAERGEWTVSHLTCEIHRCAATHSKCFATFELTISGLVRYSLSLQDGGHIQRFRQHLRKNVVAVACLAQRLPV